MKKAILLLMLLLNQLISGEAFEINKKSCDGGNNFGCFLLGHNYEEGLGVKQDTEKAIALYKKGCEGGYGTGCIILAHKYREGEITKKNLLKALEYYGKACDLKEEVGCWEYTKLKEKLTK